MYIASQKDVGLPFETALKVMGPESTFVLWEARQVFGFYPTRAEYERLSRVPFSEEVLASCRETHSLRIVPSMSVMEMLGMFSRSFKPSLQWYKDEAFANERGEAGWHLLPKELDHWASAGKSIEKQVEFLKADEQIPSARVVTSALIGNFKRRGKWLGSAYLFLRCAEMDTRGRHVILTILSGMPTFFEYATDRSEHWSIQLATEKKPL